MRHGIAASRYREQARRGISGIKTKPRLVDVPAGIQGIKKALVYFIRKVYETDPPPILDFQFWIFDYRSLRNQSEFDVSDAFGFSLIENRQSKIQNHLNTLVYWEESHAPPDRSQGKKEIAFAPSYSQLV